VALLMLVACCIRLPSAAGQDAAASLAGTSWELIKFQGSDDTTLTPDDRSKYTLAFGADGNVTVRLDCNRGRGTWKSGGPNQLQFGPLVLTRAMCPAGSLHDQIAKNWDYVRGYVLKDGHLYLSLMADGGILRVRARRRWSDDSGAKTRSSAEIGCGHHGPWTVRVFLRAEIGRRSEPTQNHLLQYRPRSSVN
jgi:heat shock protein HslJ